MLAVNDDLRRVGAPGSISAVLKLIFSLLGTHSLFRSSFLLGLSPGFRVDDVSSASPRR